MLKELFTVEVIAALAKEKKPSASLRERLRVVQVAREPGADEGPGPVHNRARKAAWDQYAALAVRDGLIDDDVRNRLTGTDDGGFRSALSELMTYFFLKEELGLDVGGRPPEAGRFGKILDFEIRLEDGNVGVEVKSPYAGPPQGTVWSGDNAHLVEGAVDEGERLTIEYHELEATPPAGFVREPIRSFPTPGGVIKEIPAGPKRAMLERLYVEYQDLCAYAHGRPIAGFNKTVFDARSPLRSMFPISEIQNTFQQRIEADCQMYSFMSIAQSAAELTTLYPNDIELVSAVTRAWNELYGAHILANGIWNIRTKNLLGVVG